MPSLGKYKHGLVGFDQGPTLLTFVMTKGFAKTALFMYVSEYSQQNSNPDAHMPQLSDDWADDKLKVSEHQGCLRACVALKQQHPHLKVILSVGGGGKGSEHFATVANDPNKRATFASTARRLCDDYGIDGIDSSYLSPPLPSTLPPSDLTNPQKPQSTGNTLPTSTKARPTSSSSPTSAVPSHSHSSPSPAPSQAANGPSAQSPSANSPQPPSSTS